MTSNKYQKGFRNHFTKVKTAKGRKLSSTLWIQRQINDPYNKLAKNEHYRSRAAFKLLEIDDKIKFIKNANNILDLGAAPGSWLQIFRQRNKNANIIGVDLLQIEPLEGCNLIKGDFLDEEIQQKITAYNKNQKFDIIASDISPNKTGHKNTDLLRSYHIAETIYHFSLNHLNPNGILIIKIFMGKDFEELLKLIRISFHKIKQIKPEASRKKSSEFYIFAKLK